MPIHQSKSSISAFDPQWYMLQNADLGAAGIDTDAAALQHWQTYGRNEGRQGAPTVMLPNAQGTGLPVVREPTAKPAEIDPVWYMNHYPDLRAAGISTVGAVTDSQGDAMMSNQVMSVGTSKTFGGAVNSIIHGGVEFINNSDHGRQMQIALQLDGAGEGLNPTEAGSRSDGTGDVTTSELLAILMDGDTLSTTTHPAY